jgi:hypothetical protein
MLGSIVDFIIKLIYITLFILFIPDFFFKLPKNGNKMSVAAVHGLLYSLSFVILYAIFNSKRIFLCSASGGLASV